MPPSVAGVGQRCYGRSVAILPREPARVVDALLTDPPVVHAMDTSADPPLGLWATEASCYRFIADTCQPGWSTIETGAGASTLIFAATGAHHTCVTPEKEEVERITEYAVTHDISLAAVTFEVGPSHRVLPNLTGEIDLAFVDGCHGFPMPTIDWFYAGSLLREGGLMIIDDLQLPASRSLMAYLREDARWAPVAGDDKWSAHRKLFAGDLAEEFIVQPFFTVREPGWRGIARQVLGPVKHSVLKATQRSK
jgi:hypothetical protein